MTLQPKQQPFREALRHAEGTTFAYAHDYDIEALPDDIRQLRGFCQVLHIDNCFRLRSISSAVGDLSLLRWLNLSYNGLTELPPAIGRLRHLERLHVNNNALKELPAELWGLRELEELRVDSNQLRALPTAVVLFPKLREFFGENNSFLGPSDVEGAEASELLPVPRSGDCSQCHGRYEQGSAVVFVSFHSICGAPKVPVRHITCSEACAKHLLLRVDGLAPGGNSSISSNGKE